MKYKMIQSGFTAVELLITLFIAAAFLTSGYQLYGLIIKDGGETRSQARASNIAYDYLQRYKSNVTSPCIAETPLTDSPVTVVDLSDVTVSVVTTCPYASATSISKILVTVKYNTPQQTVSNATYAASQDIVTDGLVLNLDAGNVGSIKGRNSIINWDSWTVSTGAVTGYAVNGDGNSRVMDTNPWGASDIIWDVSNQDAASDADGGWNTSSFSIDNTKMYRFTTWVRRKTIGNGRFYLGTSGGGASVLNRSDGVVNGNPYFYYSGATGWLGPVNQWYLAVGYVWPAGSGTGAAMPESGIYALDGTKIASSSDFVWQPTTTSSYHRSYLFYSTDITTNQQFYQPRINVIDGTEPTVTELRNNAGNTWYDLSGNGNNGILSGGVGYNGSNGGTLTFDGVNDYVIAGNSGMIHRNSDFTYNIWAMHSLTPDQYSTYFENGSWTNSLLLRQQYNTIAVYSMGTLRGTYAFTPTVGVWFNLSFVRNGNSILLYINGVYSQSIAFSADIIPNTNYIYIGTSQHSTPQTITGELSNAQIYNRALSSNEITQNFNALRGRYGL